MQLLVQLTIAALGDMGSMLNAFHKHDLKKALDAPVSLHTICPHATGNESQG